MTMFIFRARE